MSQTSSPSLSHPPRTPTAAEHSLGRPSSEPTAAPAPLGLTLGSGDPASSESFYGRVHGDPPPGAQCSLWWPALHPCHFPQVQEMSLSGVEHWVGGCSRQSRVPSVCPSSVCVEGSVGSRRHAGAVSCILPCRQQPEFAGAAFVPHFKRSGHEDQRTTVQSRPCPAAAPARCFPPQGPTAHPLLPSVSLWGWKPVLLIQHRTTAGYVTP